MRLILFLALGLAAWGWRRNKSAQQAPMVNYWDEVEAADEADKFVRRLSVQDQRDHRPDSGGR